MSATASRYRKNVAAVIMDACGRVLVGRKKSGSRFIHFPQGGVKKKETFDEALWREIMEEAGIPRDRLRITARLAGLSYDYRKKNKKKEKWAGQEQTYYLLRYEGDAACACCGNTEEFGVLEWLPYQALRVEMFVPFKRKVVEEVLKTFFTSDMKAPVANEAELNDLLRYRYESGSRLADFDPCERALFAGGKQEVAAQMEDLRMRIAAARAAGAPARMLILLADANPDAKRRTNCLRRLAALFDPLQLCVRNPAHWQQQVQGADSLLPYFRLQIPEAGEVLLASESVYSGMASLLPAAAENIVRFEQLLTEEKVLVLKFFLAVTPQQWEKSAADYERSYRRADAVLNATSRAASWYIVPSEKKWYRDYVIASIVAQLSEIRAASLQNMPDA